MKSSSVTWFKGQVEMYLRDPNTPVMHNLKDCLLSRAICAWLVNHLQREIPGIGRRVSKTGKEVLGRITC